MTVTAAGVPILFRAIATVGLFLSCWFFTSPILNAMFCLVVVYAISVFLREQCGLPVIGHAFLAIAGSLAAYTGFIFPQVPFAPYLAIVSINLVVAYVFGNRLLRGLPTVLEQFVRTAHSGPAAIQRIHGIS